MPTRTRPVAVTRPKKANVVLRSLSRRPPPATLAPTRKWGMAWPSLVIISLSHRPDRASSRVSRTGTPNIRWVIRPLGARRSTSRADLHRCAAYLDHDRAVAVGAQGADAMASQG